jgi:hypothetical protein
MKTTLNSLKKVLVALGRILHRVGLICLAKIVCNTGILLKRRQIIMLQVILRSQFFQVHRPQQAHCCHVLFANINWPTTWFHIKNLLHDILHCISLPLQVINCMFADLFDIYLCQFISSYIPQIQQAWFHIPSIWDINNFIVDCNWLLPCCTCCTKVESKLLLKVGINWCIFSWEQTWGWPREHHFVSNIRGQRKLK